MSHSAENITPVNDDSPYFWHFSRFRDVLAHIAQPLKHQRPEDAIGERVLLLLLAIATLYAAVFLLAPFFVVRRKWRALPAKGTSAVYFAALGLGFMFFEITMIQRLVQFLGYPTYSLTVTLAAILAVDRRRRAPQPQVRAIGPRIAVPILLAVLAALTLFYEFALPVDPRRRAALDRARGPGRCSRARSSRRSGSASACSCRSGSAGSRRSPSTARSTWRGDGP